MTDEDQSRARRAADIAADAPVSRPKRFVTPDWDDWDSDSPSSPGSAPEPTTEVGGGRFASDDTPTQTPSRPSSPSPQPVTGLSARHAWDDASWPGAFETAAITPVAPSTDAATANWHPIPVEPVEGAARAAQSPSLSEKRRREAPALPTTPPPPSPEERREALIGRERSGRSVAPGSRTDDDWTDAPLPASAVPPPAIGQAPAPIVVQEGEAPVAHRAYSRPEGDPEDEDTLWLTRRPTSRAEDAAGIETPISVISAPATLAMPAAETTVGQSAYDPVTPTRTSDGTVGDTVDPAGATVTSPTRVPWWRRRLVVIGLVAALILALVAGFLVWKNRGGDSSAANSASVTALVNRLVSPEDLATSGLGQWTETKTEATVTQDSPAPLCFVAAPDLPSPDAQVQRKLTATGASLLHRIATYASAADANQVYELRQTQLGACSNIPAYLVSGATVTSLGDSAVATTTVIQDQTAQYHTVVLVRTGSAVITYDLAQAGSPVPYETVLLLAAATVKAVCADAGGSCAASPVATTGVPPTTSIPGWLAVSDLPRVTVGMGRWNAPAPKTTVTSAGSACENVTFATVDGPTQRRQRTYLLTEDTKAPKNFGLDEVILDFATADAATAFATQLKASIGDCTTRTPTAKLGNTGDIQSTGAGGEAITGFWRSLSQSTNATTTYSFRLGVAVVGTRVVYLLANPSPTFDYTDADWATITARAGQRATQGG